MVKILLFVLRGNIQLVPCTGESWVVDALVRTGVQVAKPAAANISEAVQKVFRTAAKVRENAKDNQPVVNRLGDNLQNGRAVSPNSRAGVQTIVATAQKAKAIAPCFRAHATNLYSAMKNTFLNAKATYMAASDGLLKAQVLHLKSHLEQISSFVSHV